MSYDDAISYLDNYIKSMQKYLERDIRIKMGLKKIDDDMDFFCDSLGIGKLTDKLYDCYIGKKKESLYRETLEIPEKRSISKGTSLEIPEKRSISKGTSLEIPEKRSISKGTSLEIPEKRSISKGTSLEIPGNEVKKVSRDVVERDILSKGVKLPIEVKEASSGVKTAVTPKDIKLPIGVNEESKEKVEFSKKVLDFSKKFALCEQKKNGNIYYRAFYNGIWIYIGRNKENYLEKIIEYIRKKPEILS